MGGNPCNAIRVSMYDSRMKKHMGTTSVSTVYFFSYFSEMFMYVQVLNV